MTTPAAPSQTRQQLEELDSLLQRMLSLPLSPAEAAEQAQPLPPVAKVPVPLPPAPPVLVVKETPPVPGQPNVQAWRVEMPTSRNLPQEQFVTTWSPPMQAPAQSSTPPQPSVYGAPLVSPQVESKLAPIAIPVAEPRRDSLPPLPVWVWPFYLLNLVFDLSTYILGPLTRWLSFPATKHVMGWLGVMMMLLSLGFAISLWLGFDWGTEAVK